ncbi:hypothetical protein BS47DRAFT_1483898 [Hydnum rufescens UP504]|uniref:Uncharacterized protein n=1 Tax=Hydnum rufescens UP504 TaxID=1448309 RepID=A0A9P6B2Q2_9AGAM|nr:hypothetical protein BS47DRAFT_1483898 [Hydnum rufescens UP504]
MSTYMVSRSRPWAFNVSSLEFTPTYNSTMVASVSTKIIALHAECILYGVHLVLFTICFSVVVCRRKFHIILSLASVSSFLLSSIYVLLDIHQFTLHFHAQQDPNVGVYTPSGLIDAPTYTLRIVFVICTLIPDAVLIWRCFALWDQRFLVCAPPLVLLLTGSIAGFASVFGRNSAVLHCWYVTFMSTTIASNILSTTLISARIWKRKEDIEYAFGPCAGHTKYYRRACWLTLDTGALYTLLLVLWLLFEVLGSGAEVVLVRMIVQMSGSSRSLARGVLLDLSRSLPPALWHLTDECDRVYGSQFFAPTGGNQVTARASGREVPKSPIQHPTLNSNTSRSQLPFRPPKETRERTYDLLLQLLMRSAHWSTLEVGLGAYGA